MSENTWCSYSCAELSEVSRDVAAWLAAQRNVGEESITDWLLYQCSVRIAGVRYIKFSRWHEGRNSGADWDWWFVTDGATVAMRIQAKKLLDGEDHYSGLARANDHGLQIDMLLSSSATDNMLAFYAFYHGGQVSLTQCQRQLGTGEGLFLRGAQSIYDAYIGGPRQRVNVPDVLSEATPMTCLLCCPLAGNGDTLVEHLAEYHVEAVFPATDGGNVRRGIYEEPPPHIRALLNAENPGELADRWEGEISPLRDRTNGLVVFDLRSTVRPT